MWWEHEQKFFPGVIGTQVPDVGDTTASLILYDNEDGQKYMHDLDSEVYRTITPTMARIRRLKVKDIRWRLKQEGAKFKRSDGKEVIQKILYHLLKKKFVNSSKKPYAPRAKVAFSHT